MPTRRSPRRHAGAQVDVADSVDIKQREESGQVTSGARGDEPLGDEVLIDGVGFEPAGSGLGLDASPGSAGELTARRGTASHDLTHRIEGELEQVVQHEHGALRRAELLQHNKQRDTDAVIEGHPVGGIDANRRRRHRVQLILEVVRLVFVANTRRAELVEAQAADHHYQPATYVIDAVKVASQEAPGLSDDVLHLGCFPACESEVDDVRGAPPMRLRSPRQLGRSSVLLRRSSFYDEIAAPNVTGGRHAHDVGVASDGGARTTREAS
jgi:hypothetical protein